MVGDEEGLFVMAVDVEEGADDDSPELRVDVELARGWREAVGEFEVGPAELDRRAGWKKESVRKRRKWYTYV